MTAPLPWVTPSLPPSASFHTRCPNLPVVLWPYQPCSLLRPFAPTCPLLENILPQISTRLTLLPLVVLAQTHLLNKVGHEQSPFFTLQPSMRPLSILSAQSVPLRCYFLLFYNTSHLMCLLMFAPFFFPLLEYKPLRAGIFICCFVIYHRHCEGGQAHTGQVPKMPLRFPLESYQIYTLSWLWKYDKSLHQFKSCYKTCNTDLEFSALAGLVRSPSKIYILGSMMSHLLVATTPAWTTAHAF